VLALFLGQCERRRLGGRLAHVVARTERVVGQGGDGRDHDDVVAAQAPHLRHDQLAQTVRGEGVHAHHPLHLGRGGVSHRVAAARDAGIVDQDVDLAEVGQHCDHHGHVLVPAVDRAMQA
jgi:hypothetical protein